jgi:CHAD domain-containing protein
VDIDHGQLVYLRLRYTLEVVEDCFGAALEAHLAPALAQLQEVLGGVNDSFNASRLLRQIVDGMADCVPGIAGRYRDLMERQIAEHEERMRLGREQYRDWLADWNGSEMQEALMAVCPDLPVRTNWAGVVSAPVPLDPTALGKTA